MTGPLVSVLVRSVGRPTLQAALDSVAGQTYADIEVVVVAASGDSHPKLPPQCGRYPLRQVGTGGALARADAANFALDAAHGEYCVFLDDDDFHNPDHVAGLMAALQGNPGCRLAYSGTRIIDDQGTERGVIASPYDRLRLHERNYIHVGAALFARSLVAEGCRFDAAAGSCEDWDFWLQCSERTDFAFCNRASTNWRMKTGAADGAAAPDDTAGEEARTAVRGKWTAVREGLVARFAAIVEAGLRAQHEGSSLQAEREYRAALRLNALHPDVLARLAGLLDARRDTAEAMACLRLALWGNPARTDVACTLARMEIDAGNHRGADKLLAAVLRREPANVEANAMLARLRTPTLT